MKTILLGVLACVNLAFADKLQLTDFTAESGGKKLYRVRHFAELDTLREVKDWNPGQGAVPITRDQAVELAKKAAQATGRNDFPEDQLQVELREAMPFDSDTNQEIKVPAGLCLWYYEGRFSGVAFEPESVYLVTMDGRVATREITR